MSANLEHVNVTVSDLKASAAWLQQVFGWKIRWQGAAINGGETYHVGNNDSYIALYSPPKMTAESGVTYEIKGGLNHVGVTVDDLDTTEAKVKAAGFRTHNHGDYEPGRRFYFHDADQVEWEVVSYAT